MRTEFMDGAEMIERYALLKVSIILLANIGTLAAQAAAPGAPASLTLVGGTLGGQTITSSNRVITVAPGATFGGNVTFQINSTDTTNMLLGVTPNWGDRTTSFTQGNFSTSATSAPYLNLTAPLTPGTYWIIAAAGNEASVTNLLSCTSSIAGNPVWYDGNDVADWAVSTIQTANTNGTVNVPYLYPSAMSWAFVAATAIQVNVANIPGPTQRVLLTINKSGTGVGTVTASGLGFSCGAICSNLIAFGATVSLTATADPNSTFAGWSGACSGISVCNITLNVAETVTAAFTQNSPAQAALLNPPPSSVLQSESALFTWKPGTLVSEYSLKVGNSPGSDEFYASGSTIIPFAAVSGLPTDGRTIYVRLSSLILGVWQDRDYNYTASRADSQMIYDDAFQNGWSNCSSAQTDSNNPSPIRSGNSSIRVTLAGHMNLCFLRTPMEGFLDFSWFSNLNLWLHGGTDGGQLLQAQGYGPVVALPPLVAGTWQQISIPISTLLGSIPTLGQTVQISVQGLNGSAQHTFYVDDIELTDSQPPSMIHVTVDATQVIRTADPKQFGMNTGIWDYPPPADPITGATAVLAEMNVQALRFPGGGVSDEYHWETNTQVVGSNIEHVNTTFDDIAQVATKYRRANLYHGQLWLRQCSGSR
jgi:hypothetical protein